MGRDKVSGREIGAELLERWALGYLGRYASSAENLRRVLMRRARRFSPETVSPAKPLIEALVIRYRESGLLDDAAYAAGRTQSLHRRGDSLRSIRARLMTKGVPAAVVAGAVSGLRDAEGPYDSTDEAAINEAAWAAALPAPALPRSTYPGPVPPLWRNG